MGIARDPKTGRWFFRTKIEFADGTVRRQYGVPGSTGPFQDIVNSKVGAKAAELRAKKDALTKPEEREIKAEVKTIREHAIQFMATYLPEQKPSERRTKTWTLDNRLLPFFGDITIENLKQTDVDQWSRTELKRGMAIKSINNRLAILSTLIKYVTGEKSKLRFKLAGMAGEISAVPAADVEKLLAAANDDRYRVLFLLAYEAGLRAGEIRGLQWTDVKDGQITIRRGLDNATNEVIAPKHNKSRIVPLSPRLKDALASLKRVGIWVVSCLDGSLLGYWGMLDGVKAIYARAHVPRPKKAIHCLRHSFGTEMAKKVPLGVLQKLMGHADVTTTLRYVDVSEDDKRDAIELVFGVPKPESDSKTEKTELSNRKK